MVYNRNVTKSDIYYTPPWIIDLLAPYLPTNKVFWEPACGDGAILRRLQDFGIDGFGTDIETGSDFFTTDPQEHFDFILTNPPFSLKDAWIKRCIHFNKPFVLLLPITALEGKKRTVMWDSLKDFSVLIPNERVQFNPHSTTGANFCSAWFCSGLNLDKQIIFIK